ncbi:MAG: polyribonucleotide nucleotidyltransferase [Parcubacteria group bacterium]|nr:polyribonucleotide nucleotidyltransferase [Parcubacteria group bacterium]
MAEKIFSCEFGGRTLKVTTGLVAGQANGAALVQYGDTVVLVTAVMSKENREQIDFFPLTVEYEEKFYAAGKIKSSKFVKRETKPPDNAILSGRLIDRAIRPYFDQDLRRDVQIIATVLAIDGENDPDITALYGAAIALHISDIPWDGPIAGMRVGNINSEWALNPTSEAQKKSIMDMTVAGSEDHIVMLESGAQEITETQAYEAIEFANKHLSELTKFFDDIRKSVGREKDVSPLSSGSAEEDETKKLIKEKAKKFIAENSDTYFYKEKLLTKFDRQKAKKEFLVALDAYLEKEQVGKEKRTKISLFAEKSVYEIVGKKILSDEKRIDGRAADEIRQLSMLAGVLPRIHGSALFQRGETQVLSIVTLASPGMELYLETMEENGRKRFMHHYNFPPYCSGEVKSLRMTGRREIGHGALVERGLAPLMPDQEKFAYTIRVVSEVMSSNGSTSMASCCASVLALMDAGVPIKKPAAGIAIGLAAEEEKGDIARYKTFTDLQDLEDGPGGMDFKVIGTRDGITAIQMDTKTRGLTLAIVKEALEKAKNGRLKILDDIEKVLNAPREGVSKYAPRILSIRINPSRIRDVVGPGGRVINDIIAKTGAIIDIDQAGIVMITAQSEESLQKAAGFVRDLTREAKVGETYKGMVVSLMDFGAFVNLWPGQDGLVHISEIAEQRLRHPSDVLKMGDIVTVKVLKVEENGKISLSMRAAKDRN